MLEVIAEEDGVMAAPARAGLPALALEGIRRSFTYGGETLEVLAGICCTVRENEFVTLLGPSGCGKSTVFNIVAGLLPASEGRVVLCGEDVTGETGHVAYMFQRDLLLPWRTVERNLLLGPHVEHRATDAVKREARETLERLGLTRFADHYPAQLSGGMRQRAAFGRTLLFHKDLLLLDEPLGALDSQTRETMQEWLLDVWSSFRKTVFLISHDVDEAVFLSDRVLILSRAPSRVVVDLAIDLPRPRNAATRLTDAFATYRRQVYRELRSDDLGGAR